MSAGWATEETVNTYCDSIRSANSDDKIRIVFDIIRSAISDNDRFLPIRVGIVLRENGEFADAESVLSISTKLDGVQKHALFDLAVCYSRQEKILLSLELLESLRAANDLEPRQMLFMANQYARAAKFSDAERLLEEAVLSDLSLTYEALLSKSFFGFLQRFPKQHSLDALSRIFETYSRASTQEIEEAIIAALDSKTPYMLLRMGDGEGAHIFISLADEVENFILYKENRKEFLEIWFKDQSIIDTPNYSSAIRRFNEAISNADCIGAYTEELVRHEYRIGSRRGIPYIVNTLRVAEELAQRNPDRASETKLSGLTVHYDLLLSGALDRLLENRDHIGLIACHDRLPQALKTRYNIGSIDFIKVPGEKIHVGALGVNAIEGEHWPDRFDEICRTISSSSNVGKLYLVGAGMLGKVYCNLLKKSGAVVLDLGAVMDIWMGAKTRTFPNGTVDYDISNVF
ncbi:hypothetical protein DFI02_104350 [Rhizobium sp. PP-F2F-G20b]|nr:hypothetical protein DFI02_104350 [Rhizobium sp. PP-F2F-G20b]